MKTQDKRSVPARCANCRFWLSHDGTKDGEQFGECKRFPPNWVTVDGHMEQSCPLTNPLDWCGEFQMRHDA
jgi:hypothetical protein